ncbi:T4 family baseplate hub assembly chaperone [Mucilaginibacter agri]|uniref:Phage baseplate protein n=1 Tax=Mucilaginibacter agri TaxID=2695265 RepID=A0A966DVP3_9SPHI|nr:hypothetical protein [Mucilaginibacter agri]NCD71681.1 hypothetical protein [Mucilaginibacter agri]
MKPLDATELFQLWDEVLHDGLLDKSMRLLGKACSFENSVELGRLSIGERDARLLQLREWMFGYSLKNMVTCPKCNEVVEWEMDTHDMHLQKIPADLSVKTFYLVKDQFKIQFRLPDSFDVSKIISENSADPDSLITNCIVGVANENGEEIPKDQLSGEIIQALDKRMSEEDPQADIRIEIHCPACSHNWESVFDIMSFLWAEIDSWAKRMMQEICLLAKSFGWSEKDILNMSPHRRRLYIEMLT